MPPHGGRRRPAPRPQRPAPNTCSWAAAHYRPHQVYSLDWLRAVVSDDECDQDATADALTLLTAILHTRLARRLTTVVDATSSSVANRAWLLALAAEHGVPAVAVVVTAPLDVCLARQAARPGPAPGRRWGRAVPITYVDNHPLDRPRTCGCGCGGVVAGARQFLPGHDQRAIHERISEQWGSAMGFIRWFDDTYRQPAERPQG
ncbi:AAA family ATPase [Micromonospora sp. NPDC047074]|uniref:AAA family ATPase n=1 Tax=Micromonospora sp. NPDC047074 TaxID=3154339 RepID=UPI0033CEBC05